MVGFGGIAVDQEHGHLFISAGNRGSTIAVTDYAGAIVTRLLSEPGASGMVVDSGKLYVALFSAGKIDVIDTATLAPISRLSLGGLTRPFSLALAGGRLWFNYGDCGGGSVGIGSLDPVTGAVRSYSRSPFPSYCPRVSAAPQAPNRLFAWDTGISSTRLHEYDVSGTDPVVVGWQDLQSVGDVIVGPSGATVIATSVSQAMEFQTSDLSPTGVVYPIGSYGVALAAVSTDHGGFVATGGGSPYGEAIRVYPDGTPTSRMAASLASPGSELGFQGLAFSRDGTKLFAVGQNTYRDNAVLFVIQDPTYPNTIIDSGPRPNTNSLSATFTFRATDPEAAFTCRIDGGPATWCVSPFTIGGLADGDHELSVAATVGVADPTPATWKWTVDTRAPTVSLTRPTGGLYVENVLQVERAGVPSIMVSLGRISFEATSSDDRSTPTVLFRIDGATVCTVPAGPYVCSWQARAGLHDLTVRALDAAGNTSSVSRTIVVA